MKYLELLVGLVVLALTAAILVGAVKKGGYLAVVACAVFALVALMVGRGTWRAFR